MWPFNEKPNHPGFKNDNLGNGMFELTEEERLEVTKTFNNFLSDGPLYTPADLADNILTSILGSSNLMSDFNASMSAFVAVPLLYS
ncbi:MAG: hypothetical protein HQK99_12390 [Nitrospirae bacterium]|nr:hypothetical protein [Nitrospirota bacterium]